MNEALIVQWLSIIVVALLVWHQHRRVSLLLDKVEQLKELLLKNGVK